MSAIIVLGAGGHAKVVISTLRAMGHTVTALFDDAPHLKGVDVMGVRVEGAIREAAKFRADGAVIGIGNARVRKRIADGLPLSWITAVHPGAMVDASARIGPGSVVCAGAVIQPDVEIGAHVIVNSGANLDHDCWIADYVHLAPGVSLAGQVAVGQGTMIGIGASVIQCRSIGAWSMIGAGAAVVQDLPDQVLAMGVPAKIVRRYDDSGEISNDGG